MTNRRSISSSPNDLLRNSRCDGPDEAPIFYCSPRASTDMNAFDCTYRGIHRGCDLSPRISRLQTDDRVADQYAIDDSNRWTAGSGGCSPSNSRGRQSGERYMFELAKLETRERLRNPTDELQEITGRAFQPLRLGDSVERRSDI